MDYLENFNRTLFLLMNAGGSMSTWLIQVAVVVANDLIYLIPLFLVALWLWGDARLRNQALKACLVALLALGANQLIGLVYTHPRPFMLGLGHTWTYHTPDSSFPSDHVTILTTIGLTLLSGGALRLAIAVLMLDLAVAWARIFVGVHFPLDMLGAAVVAVGAYGAVTPVWRTVGEPITELAERLYHIVFARPIAAGWIRG